MCKIRKKVRHSKSMSKNKTNISKGQHPELAHDKRKNTLIGQKYTPKPSLTSPSSTIHTHIIHTYRPIQAPFKLNCYLYEEKKEKPGTELESFRSSCWNAS